MSSRIAPQAAEDIAALRARFIEAMGAHAASVNVVTTDGHSGKMGLTASAFSSVSADPPTLLVCINQRSPICNTIQHNGRFAVNVLNESQPDISNRFAGRPDDGEPYDFNACAHQAGTFGQPLIQGAAASFECEVREVVLVGSHAIIIGAVHEATAGSAGPLVYARRHYGKFAPHS